VFVRAVCPIIDRQFLACHYLSPRSHLQIPADSVIFFADL